MLNQSAPVNWDVESEFPCTDSSSIASADKAKAIDCNLIAPWYELVEHLCFGRALERRRFAFLESLGDAKKVLSCGEGDGRFATALLRSNPGVQVTAVDASVRMARIATQRVMRACAAVQDRLQYHCGEIDSFNPASTPYDLIATHFFLDCFSNQQGAAVINRIAGWTTPHARWLVSEFAQPPNGFAHVWTGAVIRSLYAAFRITTGLRAVHLPDYRPALASVGFELQRQEYACGGLLVSELWERK